MREILFSGKRDDSGEWISGMPCATEQSGIYAIQTMEGGIFDIIPESVSEFTGLTDKNGTKIFEGDILEITSEYYSRKEKSLYKVKYHEATASWCAFAIDFIQRVPLCKNECKYYKVIGNIHDNPELLKGVKSDA